MTIALKSGAQDVRAGESLAIFNPAEGGYKGEAQVTDIDDGKKFCFARVTLKHGQRIKAGDSAATNLNRSIGIDAATGKPTVPPAVRKRIETVLSNPRLATLVHRYLHKKADSRRVFAETLYWQPYLVTDEKGEAEVTFDVSASVTTWKVYALSLIHI